MKIFVAIRQPRHDLTAGTLTNCITSVIQSLGHMAFIAYSEIIQRNLTPRQFMPYVRHEISTSDLVIVVYSANLRGGLIELGIAYALDIPIWLAVPAGEYVSSSALACAAQVVEYATEQDLEAKLHHLIAGE